MAVWPNIDAHLDGEGIVHGPPTYAQTEGGQHSSTSLHYQGRARDYGNLDFGFLDDEMCNRIYHDLEQYAQGDYILQELFWNPIGCWQKGRRVGPVPGHYNHVHAGLALGKFLPVRDRPPLPPPKPTVFEEEEVLT